MTNMYVNFKQQSIVVIILNAVQARLFRILYAGFAELNEFSELSALSHSPKMFAINICIQDPIKPQAPSKCKSPAPKEI